MSLDFLLTNNPNIEFKENIPPELIQTTIDSSLNRTRRALLSHTVDFTSFCEFVLPYQIYQDKPTNWRKTVYSDIGNLIDSLTASKSNDSAIVSILNKKLSQGFIFDTKTDSCSNKGWDFLFKNKRGGCVSMAYLVTYPLRLIGIPTTIDYVPAWANVDGGHTWNVILQNGKSFPFLGLESTPRSGYNPTLLFKNNDSNNFTYKTAGKVFRKTFKANPEISKDDPIFITNPFFSDVTHLYYKTSSVKVPVDTSVNLSATHFYLATFSVAGWRPIFYGKVKHCQIEFKNMACEVIYLPISIDSNNEAQIYGKPFIIRPSGEIYTFMPGKSENISITSIKSIPEDQLIAVKELGWSDEKLGRRLNSIVNEKSRSKPKDNIVYKLFYWDNGWKLCGQKLKKKGKSLSFANIPSNTLYHLEASDDLSLRIFTINKGKQIWW